MPLLVTPNRPLALYKNEKIIYDMIARRMVGGILPGVREGHDERGSRMLWRGIRGKKGASCARKAGAAYMARTKEDTILPDWKEGDTLAMAGCSMSSGMTRPKPLHTESSLLAAMETAGREGVEDEEARQALKDCGIGTATRAAIIETLLRREYMTRVKKSLVPTEKGLALYSIVKEMDIADVEMTGQWEAELAKIEKGKTAHEAFMRDIEAYTENHHGAARLGQDFSGTRLRAAPVPSAARARCSSTARWCAATTRNAPCPCSAR